MAKINPIMNRYEFVILYDVLNGNPNGDPDADNMPRIDPDTNIGIVTDVCIKRKIRNYIERNCDRENGYDIYVTRKGTLNSKDEQALKELKPNAVKKEDEEKFVTDFMTQRYFDIRTFGAVLTGFTKDETKKYTTSGGKLSGNAGQLTGPVQLAFGHSIDPIYPQNITITRQAITTEKDAEKKSNEMGNKWIVPYGLYRTDGYISATLANRTGFSDEDIKVLWNAILNMFEDDRSASRGQMAVRKLIVFKHDSKLGNAPAHKLLESVKITKKEGVETPRSFNDYKIVVPSPDELPNGVSIKVYE